MKVKRGFGEGLESGDNEERKRVNIVVVKVRLRRE